MRFVRPATLLPELKLVLRCCPQFLMKEERNWLLKDNAFLILSVRQEQSTGQPTVLTSVHFFLQHVSGHGLFRKERSRLIRIWFRILAINLDYRDFLGLVKPGF